MILSVHIVMGAAVVSKIGFLPLAFLLAFLSHYLLDSLPHWEYSIKNIKQKKWKRSFSDFLKLFLDVFVGVLLLFFLSKNLTLALMGGFLAVLPDTLTFLNIIFPNIFFEAVENLHQKIHFPEPTQQPQRNASALRAKQAPYKANKKLPLFWGILFQLLILIATIPFLL